MEGERMDSHRKVLKMFSQNIEFPFFKREREFCSFSSFLFFFYASFSLFFLCSVSLLRMNLGIFEMFEEKTNFKLPFKWDGSGYTNIYEIRGVAENLSAVDAYPRMDLCTSINFFGEARSKISRRKNHFEKIQKLKKNTSLNKVQ
jgi:hypothetical protein